MSRWPAILAVSGVVAVVSACSGDEQNVTTDSVAAASATAAGDDVPAVDDIDGTGLDAFVEVYEVAARDLRPTLFFFDDPWLDLGVAIGAHRAAEPRLARFEDELPAAADVPARLGDEYAAVLGAVAEWRADVVVAADALEAGEDEFAPVAADWQARIAAGADEPPPAEIRELIDAGRDAADRLGQRCAELALAADVVVDCFAMFAEPGAPDPGDGPAAVAESGSLSITVDGVDLTVDIVDASGGTSFGDRAAFDLGPMMRLWVGPPLAATDGTPWPDDPAVWLADLGLTVTTDEVIELGSREFRHLVVAPTGEPFGLLDNELADTGTIDLPPEGPLHLWVGEIEGATVVATLGVAIAEDEAILVPVASDILRSLRPA